MGIWGLNELNLSQIWVGKCLLNLLTKQVEKYGVAQEQKNSQILFF
jgi:hypothetical protein